MRRSNRSFGQLFSSALFIVLLLIVLLLIIVSNGRVLNPQFGLASSSLAAISVTVFCWTIMLLFLQRLTIGRWKYRNRLQSAVLTGVLMTPPVLAINRLAPAHLPDIVEMALVGCTAVACGWLADRLVSHRHNALRAKTGIIGDPPQ